MKDGLKILGLLIAAIVISGWVSNLFEAKAPSQLLQGVWSRTPAYNTASSSQVTVGPDLSTRILFQKGGRGSANICNTNATSEAYLFYATTTAHGPVGLVATTTANVEIQPETCFEIDRDNLFTGEVSAMFENASNTLQVSELIGF